MQRFVITGLALVATAASTIAIYLRWEVVERDSRIAALERDITTARKSSETAAGAKSSPQTAKEDIARQKTGQDAGLRATPR